MTPSRTSKPHQCDGHMTPLRFIRGTFCLVFLVTSAFVLLVYFGVWTAVALRFFSVHYSRKVTGFVFGSWIALWPFLFEKINKTKVIFSGESVPPRERVILIANHRTEVDWMYLWDLAVRKDCQGCIKYVLKSSLMKLPVFGWVFHVMEFLPVERRWEADEPMMRLMLSSFTNPDDSLWLAVFPEGTDFTPEKCLRGQRIACERGLPLLKNVLLPKTKGFHTCLETLRDSIDAVYDITIGYRNKCPSFLDNVFGIGPSEVHIHVRRVPINEIGLSEQEVSSWLMDTFQLKDEMLSEFDSKGHFLNEGTEGGINTVKYAVNFVAVMLLTGTCMFFTLFSAWFRIYVSSVCGAMVTITYFNVWPSSFLRS